MRHVTIETLVPAADSTEVFSRIADFARYPEFTDAVREVSVVAAADGSVHSEWAVNFRNGILRWSERDEVDAVSQTITFSQIDGDFEIFDGTWRVDPAGRDVLVWFEAGFDLGMPSLAAIIDPIAERALIDNIQRILTGLLGPSVTFSVVASVTDKVG